MLLPLSLLLFLNSSVNAQQESPTPPPPAANAAQDVQGFLEPFVYDPRGRRDPFKSYGGIIEESSKKSLLSEDESKPLQSYDIDQFKLVAVMWNVNNPRAMFMDPKAQIHIVGRDERIGRKNGYIAVIREGEVVVVEQIKNEENQSSYSTKVLRILR